MEEEFQDYWQDWTPCEMYGHQYNEDGRCDCGEYRIEDEVDGD